jgi:D-alanyl-D-alanine carboxypeptidase
MSAFTRRLTRSATVATISIGAVVASSAIAARSPCPAGGTPAAGPTLRTGTALDRGCAPLGRTASARVSDPQARLAALVRAGVPGAVALVRDGARVHTFTAGLADVELRRPMRAGLRFRVGSLSKPVVATLALKLVAERRLRLSDTVAGWLPGLLPAGRRITINELLQHRSGLFNYTDSPQLFAPLLTGQLPPSYVWTARQLVGLATQHPLDFAPGTRFEYSNTNYIVLGLIIERVTHTPLERYAQHTLFDPLRMRFTAFALGRVSGAHAHGYVPFLGPFPAAPGGLGDTEPLNGSQYGAAGSLVSTADDLDRFFRALFTGRVIPRRLVALMQATRPAVPAPDYQRYGLGLEGNRYPCASAWGHGGTVWGYRAVVRASRDAEHLIVLLINHDSSPSALAAAITTTVSELYCGT